MSRIHHDRLVSLMKVYFVTDRHLFELETVEEACRSMLEAGVRTIQLRDKEATAEDLLASALRLR
ncbi:MAG: thiamine phosphate synthase, partial [Candidatus Fermentibacter daniensis]